MVCRPYAILTTLSWKIQKFYVSKNADLHIGSNRNVDLYGGSNCFKCEKINSLTIVQVVSVVGTTEHEQIVEINLKNMLAIKKLR